MTAKYLALKLNKNLKSVQVSGQWLIMDGDKEVAKSYSPQSAWNDAYNKLAEKQFKTGDLVVMENCLEASRYVDKVWKCRSDSFKAASGDFAVFLENFGGYFCCEFLRLATSLEQHNFLNGGEV